MTLRQEPCSFYHDLLGFSPKDDSLFHLAFLHNSCRQHDPDGHPVNNERLEFLGDAVIESCVSEVLYRRFPDATEGFLTSMRSRIVQRESLNRVAASLHLERYISANLTLDQHNRNLLGNAFEALVGAVCLDQGYDVACDFLRRRLFTLIDMEQIATREVDFKSRLFEWAQKSRVSISFDDRNMPIPSSGDAGFHTTLMANGIKVSEAWGYSKKEAQQKASRYALRDFQHFPSLLRRVTSSAS